MKYELKMIIEEGIELKALFDSEEEFSESVESLNRLSNKYRLISIRERLLRLWNVSGEAKVLSDQIQDTSHRLALCLLDSYPAPKSTSIISSEVGLTEGATSNNLGGRRGGAGNLFMRTSDGWTLSDQGLDVVLSEIFPNYL